MSKTQDMDVLHDEAAPQRGEARRRQVLEAASECFCQYGFHGASMDQIAKKAEMSVGHIYHYFKNKEAIIAAIVEKDLQHRLQKISAIQADSEDGDIFSGMTARIGEGLDDLLKPSRVALRLECLAEATRTPQVAAMIRNADKITRERWTEVRDQGRTVRQLGTDPYREARTEVLGAIFEGLTVRSILNPDVDRKKMVDFLRRIVMRILETD